MAADNMEDLQIHAQEIQDALPAKEDSKRGGLGTGILVGVFLTLALVSILLTVLLVTGVLRTADKGQTLQAKDIRKAEALNGIINRYYYLPEAADVPLTDRIYKGMVMTLDDPYSEYYTEEDLNSFLSQSQGIYYGIGAYVGFNEEEDTAMIVGVFEGSPAETAGLADGDLILEVDGVNVKGMDTTQVVTLIKGEEDTSVHILFSRENETFERDIVRRKIDTPTVEHEMLEDGIGYLRITEFDEVTTEQFKEAYADLNAQGMRAFLLDLRDNPGGNVTTVCEIARQMLPEGLIFYSEDRSGNREEQTCDGKNRIDIPMAVLINGNSASASEILSGAVKDYGIATIVGTTSYGKGVIQRVIDLEDGTAVKLTISSYYSPAGNAIHGIGIAPDVYCELDTDAYLEDGTDSQRERAVEVLKEALG